ncbi:MAG: prephenate dehydratase [Planctomycetota bacterium]|nr:MAG: prephenate dehydratase [Planctomycetota bacterium]
MPPSSAKNPTKIMTDANPNEPIPADQLGELRKRIDSLDEGLVGELNKVVSMLNERAGVAVRIGQVKAANSLEVWSPAREEEVLARVAALSKGPLPDESLRLIFRELMSGSRATQQAIRVASLGPKHSYSHMAAIAKFGNSVEHVSVGSIAAVFEEVHSSRSHFGIVPLENSTDGRIADTLDMFVRLPNIKIRAEVRLRVRHCLLGRCERGQVRRIYSRAQALSQCRHWLAKNLPHVELIETTSTAAASERSQAEPGAAAIAGRQAADAYRLDILASDIEDHPHNVTRFAVLAPTCDKATGNDKTTLMVRLPNRSGALHDAVTAPLLTSGRNMTWIESFPVAERPSSDSTNPSYLFFLDIEGHTAEPEVAEAIAAMKLKSERLDVLGSYPKSAALDH